MYLIAFPTIDNRLCMVAQARDESGVWHDVEKLSPSGCGNSYYDVFLNQGNQWKVVAPIPSGKFCTKLRLAVYYRTPNGGKVAYSNEYSASINLGQLIIEK